MPTTYSEGKEVRHDAPAPAPDPAPTPAPAPSPVRAARVRPPVVKKRLRTRAAGMPTTKGRKPKR